VNQVIFKKTRFIACFQNILFTPHAFYTVYCIYVFSLFISIARKIFLESFCQNHQNNFPQDNSLCLPDAQLKENYTKKWNLWFDGGQAQSLSDPRASTISTLKLLLWIGKNWRQSRKVSKYLKVVFKILSTTFCLNDRVKINKVKSNTRKEVHFLRRRVWNWRRN